MTGLSPEEDRILEVAAIATDWDLNEIATYTAVQRVDEEIIRRRMFEGEQAAFWNGCSDVRDTLVAQNESGQPSDAVESVMLAFVEQHFEADKPVLLGGNSIHQDRKFIDREWPRFSQRLHYRMLDVSAWKVVFEGKLNTKFGKPESHRALDDIRGSIQELEYYLKKVVAS